MDVMVSLLGVLLAESDVLLRIEALVSVLRVGSSQR